MGRDSSTADDRPAPAATGRAVAGLGPESPLHDVLAALAVVRAEAGRLAVAASRSWSLSDAELRDAVAQGGAARSVLDAAFLALVKALDDRPSAAGGGPAHGADGAPVVGRVARTFLVEALRLSPSQAAADVSAAHALDPETGDLPAVSAALREGAIARAHADTAVRVARDLPRRLATTVLDPETGTTGMAAADAFLAEHARRESPRTVAWLGEQVLARLAPDRADRHDPDAVLRRGAWRAWDSTGMLRGRFQLDGAAGAAFTAVWDHLAAPHPAGTATDETGQPALIRDDRSHGMRLADALCAMARLAASRLPNGDQSPPGQSPPDQSPPDQQLAGPACDRAPDTAADARSGQRSGQRSAAARADGPPAPVQIIVTATLEQVAAASANGFAHPTGLAHQHTGGRGPVPAWLLARLACDATLQRVLLAPGGAVLDLGRRIRLATSSQRRALTARDGGCVIPGCSAPPEQCDVHHVIPWSTGGSTDLGNLALVCARHHTGVHARHWQLTMRDGVPWASPPPWIDVHRRPLRNTTHQSADLARRVGEQLHLLLNDRADLAPDPPDG